MKPVFIIINVVLETCILLGKILVSPIKVYQKLPKQYHSTVMKLEYFILNEHLENMLGKNNDIGFISMCSEWAFIHLWIWLYQNQSSLNRSQWKHLHMKFCLDHDDCCSYMNNPEFSIYTKQNKFSIINLVRNLQVEQSINCSSFYSVTTAKHFLIKLQHNILNEFSIILYWFEKWCMRGGIAMA